jgi:hypothetical protein
MMKKIRITAIALCVVLVSTMLSCRSKYGEDYAAIFEKTEELHTQYIEAFNTGKLEALRSFYRDNASLVVDDILPIIDSNMPAVNDADEILKYLILQHYQKFRFTWMKTKKISFDKSIVIDMGMWKARLDTQNISGTYLCQWRHEYGKWQIENEIFNYDNNVNAPLGNAVSAPRQ